MKTASWVIVSRATGEAVFETFNPKMAATVNAEKYQAVPILEYLYEINDRIKAGLEPRYLKASGSGL